MDSLEVYRLYVPIKLHFTDTKFDVFQTKRLKGATLENFIKRPDTRIFHNLAKGFKTPQECVQYFVSNFAYGSKDVLYNVDVGVKNLKTWKKRRESISEVFENDFCFIRDKNLRQDQILSEFVHGNIALESIVIMNEYFDFVTKWTENILWDQDVLRVRKSKGFVKYKPERIENIMTKYK